mgnify:CR=1 FL=1
MGTVAAPSFRGAVLLCNLRAQQGIHHDGESTRCEDDLATQHTQQANLQVATGIEPGVASAILLTSLDCTPRRRCFG